MWQVCSLASSTYLSLKWLVKFIYINWNKRIPFPCTCFRFYTGCVSVKYSPLRCWSNLRILSKMLSSRHVQRLLRFCETSITWIRSLSVILRLYGRHGIAERPLTSLDTQPFPAIYGLRSTKQQFWLRYLTFSVLTWLDGPIFLLYLSVHKTNFLRAVLWIFEWSYLFAVASFMVRKCSFFSNFIRGCHCKHFSFTHFYWFENSLYFMKYDSEVITFFQKGIFIIHNKWLTSHFAITFVDENRYSSSIKHFDTPIYRYNTRKYSLGESV